MNWRATLRAVVLLGVSAGLTGCPLMLEDDFKTVPADASSNGGGGTSGGGLGAAGGKTSSGAGDANAAAAAGEPVMPGGGSGGTPGQGGMGMAGNDAGAAGLTGEGGTPNVDPCTLCTADEECCNGQCVDLRFDPRNCRECGMGCPGTTCDNSSCTNTCVLGAIDCNHNVVDGCEVNPALDPHNCGNCDIVCGFQLECVAGYCVCPVGTADCDGNKDNGCETDTSSDKTSCGGCGKACGANQDCAGSACGCALGFADCNVLPEDGCEADLTAPGTCGSCTLDCGPHSSCVAAGECGCVTGYLECDDQAAGCETTTTDPLHCGDCQTSCTPQLPACDGSTCNSGCGALTRCGDSCVDTDIDLNHCGGCDKPVGLNQRCVGGLPECVPGFDDCDSDATDCEINSQTDIDHCGACDSPCKLGALCDGGACGCAPSTPNDCGASCEQCCNDTQCSDGDSCTADTCSGGVCGSGAECAGGGLCCSGTGCFACCNDEDCGLGKVCSSNQCVQLTCTLPEILCDSKCVNSNTDAKNCGGCGNKCGMGRSCAGAACTPKWVGTAAPPVSFVAREKAAYAALGSKVFVWGGNNASAQALSDGAIYDAETDTWTTVGTGGTPPSARVLATAVWTGSVMVVWGGGDVAGNADYNSGSRYDPVSNTWQAMSTVGAPSARRSAYGFWTGSRVLFYSGVDRFGNALSSAYWYDPVNDTWATGTTSNRPTGRLDPTVSWTGSLLIVYGGRIGGTVYDDAYTFELATDDWDQVPDGPNSRSGAFGGWDGVYHLVWSGNNGATYRTDGRLFDPTTNAWTNMLTAGAPAARRAPHRQSGWSYRISPRVRIMVGGYDANGYRTDGGIYNSTTNAWTSVAAWPSLNSHLWGASVWTGTELVMWGGRTGTGTALTSTGDRYLP